MSLYFSLKLTYLSISAVNSITPLLAWWIQVQVQGTQYTTMHAWHTFAWDSSPSTIYYSLITHGKIDRKQDWNIFKENVNILRYKTAYKVIHELPKKYHKYYLLSFFFCMYKRWIYVHMCIYMYIFQLLWKQYSRQLMNYMLY